MSYYYQKIIPNEVIYGIEKLILEGKKYKEIKEVYKVSDGTITRIKQGKIKSDRVIKNNIELVPIEKVSEIQRELQEARKSLLEARKINNNQKNEINKLREENQKLKQDIKELEDYKNQSKDSEAVSNFFSKMNLFN